jgi:sulfonate transport system substrate-binding protein
VTTPAAEKRLLEHSFPGNIRELENVVHHALLVCHGNAITPADLRLTTMQPRAQASAAGAAPHASSLEAALTALFEQDIPGLYEHVENTLVRSAYRYCENNQLQTARLLGISRNVVRARLIQCGELSATIRPPRAEPTGATPRDNVRSMAPLPRAWVEPPRVMRIGYQPFGLLTHVKTRGELERVLSHQGAAIIWKEFHAGMPMMQALQSNELDCGVVGEVSPILAQAAGFPLVHLTTGPPMPEGEAIIVHAMSPIRSVADLRGRTVVLQQGSNVHYLLFRALEEAGLRHDDVRLSFAAPDEAHGVFMNGKADAWAIWDPWLASVQATTHARVLRDGQGLASNTAHYVARRGFAEAHADWVACFVKEIHAVDEWAARDGHLLASVASQLHLPGAAITTTLRRRRDAPLVRGELLASQQRVADALLRWRLIQLPVTVSDAEWPDTASFGSAAVAV